MFSSSLGLGLHNIKATEEEVEILTRKRNLIKILFCTKDSQQPCFSFEKERKLCFYYYRNLIETEKERNLHIEKGNSRQ